VHCGCPHRNTYTLKIEKTLNKKLDAPKHQQSVLYGYTRGGLVITADAATFEPLLFHVAKFLSGDVSEIVYTK
jgi:hypothetical protein